ncbi:hypothetical protein E2C01_032152 [Portunus trituberculatus]|uniref:Uncharacterized protein n=1 Tax=Portunus trituberculatus TaxID=210409 RepID=A0A5B7EVA5_PORTR|nr:hypothetical protein [Portunus trituberculatus]
MREIGTCLFGEYNYHVIVCLVLFAARQSRDKIGRGESRGAGLPTSQVGLLPLLLRPPPPPRDMRRGGRPGIMNCTSLHT